MSDPFLAASTAIADRQVIAPLLVASAGLASGVGPCAGIRSAVLTAMVSANGRSRGVLIGAFTLGIVTAYSLLGLAVPLFDLLVARSQVLYALLAVALIVSGVRCICAREHRCHRREGDRKQSGGPAFMAGLASSAILSPCCMPLIIGILSTESQTGHPQVAAAYLAAFAFGHAVPTMILTMAVAAPLRRFLDWAKGDSLAIVSGALQIGVGTFYAVLA